MTARSGFTVAGGATIATTWGNGVRDHLMSRTTSDDVASEGQMAVNTSTDQVVIHNGSGAVQFGGYGTPNAASSAFFTQTGYTVGTTSLSAEYTRYGTHWVCSGQFSISTVASPGTAGNGISFFISNLPAVTTSRCVGSFVFLDSSTGGTYGGALFMAGGGNVMTLFSGDGAIGVNPSLGLAASDAVWFSINYHDI